MKIAKIKVAIPILSICPKRRMVPTDPEAMPYSLLSTELIMALMFGEENRANPNPRIIRLRMIKGRTVLFLISVKSTRPKVVRAIPSEAITRGSILSESFPANGEKAAIIIGWAIKTAPAPFGVNPFIYCR